MLTIMHIHASKNRYVLGVLGILIALTLCVPVSAQAQLLSPTPLPSIGPMGTSPSPFPTNAPIRNSPNPYVKTWDGTVSPDPTITDITNGAAPTTVSTYCKNYKGTISAGGVSLADVLKYFTCTLQKYIVPLLLAVGMLLFILGMVKFITSAEGEERAEGRQFMIWGVVGFAVIFSVWGILSIFNQTFRLDNSSPTVPTTTSVKIQG